MIISKLYEEIHLVLWKNYMKRVFDELFLLDEV